MMKRSKIRKDPLVREREALQESIRNLEVQVHHKDALLTQLRREIAALRLLVSIHRVRDDPRMTTSTTRDAEMNEYVFAILEGREVEMMDYETARLEYDRMKAQAGTVRTYEA